MGRKTYKIQSEIKVDMICVPRSNMCPNDHVYLNLELFGETQRTKLLHPLFPIKTSDRFYFDKVFWSPQNEHEFHKLMRESPVSIELRCLPSGSTESSLFAFSDSDSHKLLIEDSKSNVKGVVTTEKEVFLTQNKRHCGQLPCVKLEIKSTITVSETPAIDKLIELDTSLCAHCDMFHMKKSMVPSGGCHVRPHCGMFSCNCELHRKDNSFHCSTCHQDRAVSPGSKKCQQKVYRDHSNHSDRSTDDSQDETQADVQVKMRPPFVVRKVSSSIMARKPDAYDSVYNGVMREQLQRRSSRKKKLHRLRSCSPKVEKRDNRSPSSKHSTKTTEVCYACSLPSHGQRLSCDACNLTARGESSHRCEDIVRPEPPMLRTYRETTDQRPIYPINANKCARCLRRKVKRHGHTHGDCATDDCLLSSTRPLYTLDGYRDMAKYFSHQDSREY